ncbi:hypothetical protein [Cupriavidus sp. DF5525]|uniref:hypothetical protein n=1 Tax=Cupriavidus sp. DF5525 TaxID=3160989 RepID=UPI0032DF7DBE
MRDPLANFDWPSLYRRYDETCRGYRSYSSLLAVFGSRPPASDRALYYELINRFSPAESFSCVKPLGIYEALLYWKLYSQGRAIKNIGKWIGNNADERQRIQEDLIALFGSLPSVLHRDVKEILSIIRMFDEFEIPVMKNLTALPVRTTFLHFLYPSIVPIFDQYVLKAVGAWKDNANHNIQALEKYLPHAWMLSDKYANQATAFRETSLRIIDMALWVARGRQIESC